jgi:hypothetical protein
VKALSPKALLHLEALAVLSLACAAYRNLGASWLLFAALFLAPDVFLLGYLSGARVGAWAYNAGHTYLSPLALAGVGYLASLPVLMPISVIWVAHIGFDRLLGYGLKYETQFKDTHLGRV